MSEFMVDVGLNLQADQYVASMGQALNLTKQYADVASGVPGAVQNLSQSMVKATSAVTGFNKMQTVSIDTAAAYEKQLSNVQAKTTITGQSFDKLAKTTKSWAREFPIGMGEATKVMETLQAQGIKSEKQMGELGKSFIKLGAATGTSASGMGAEFLQLSKTMGNGVGQFEKLSDSLVSVTAKMGGSAPGVVAFSKALAPVAATVGISQTAVMGLSTSMSKLGEDGGFAASSLNKVMLDMNRAIRDGGPELKAYADVMGMTVGQLEKMQKTDPASVVTKFTKAVADAGPDVTRTLEALGFDSVRTTRSLSALARSGGVEQSINESIKSYGNGSTEKAAQEAMDGLTDSSERLRETMGQVVQDVGQPMLGLANGLMTPVNMVASGVQGVTGSSAGQAVLGAGGVGGFAAGIGGNIVAAATVVKLGSMLYDGVIKPKVVSPYQQGMAAARAGAAVAPGGAMGTMGYARAASAMSLLGPSNLANSSSGAIAGIGRAANALSKFALEGGARYQASTANLLGNGPRVGVTPLMQEQRGVMGGALRSMGSAFGSGDMGGLRDSTKTLATTLRDYGKGYTNSAGGAGGSIARGLATTATLPLRGAAVLGSVGLRAGGALMSGMNSMGISPAMMGIAGVAAGGMYAYSEKKKSDERIAGVRESRMDVYSRFNDFAESTGRASKGVVSMADAVDNTTKLILDANTTWADSFDVTSKEIAQATSVGYEPDLPFFGDSKNADALAFQAQAALPADATMDQISKVLLDVAAITKGDQSTITGVSEQLSKMFGPGATQGGSLDPRAFLETLNANSGNFGASFTEAQGELAASGASTINRQAFEAGQLFGGTITEGDTTVNAEQATQLFQAERLFKTAQQNALFLDEGTRVGVSETIGSTLGLSDSQVDDLKNNAFKPGKTDYDYPSFLQDIGKADEYGAAQRGGVTMDLVGGKMNYGSALAGELPANIKESQNYLGAVAQNSGATTEWRKTIEGLSDSLFSVNKVAQGTKVQLGDMTDTLVEFAGGDVSWVKAMKNTGDPVAAQEAVDSLLSKLGGSGASTPEAQAALGIARAESGVGRERDVLTQAAEQLQANRAVASAGKTQGAMIMESMQVAKQLQNAPRNANTTGLITGVQMQSQEAQAAGLSYMTDFNRGYGALQQNISATKRSAGVSSAGVRAQADMSITQTREDYALQKQYSKKDFATQKKYATKDFNVSQDRANEDYGITRVRQERDFNTQVERSGRDFKKQMSRAEDDYLKSRSRAFEDYGIQQGRAQRDFDKSMQRAERDFQKQSERGEQDYLKNRTRSVADFNKQMSRMVEDATKSMYDPFKRIQAAMVMDAGQLLTNLKDQQKTLDKQVGDLAKARSMGLTDDTIKALGLADAQNAQQLSRLVGDLGGNTDLAAQLNEAQAGKASSSAALFTDSGNTTYARSQEDMATQLARMDEDYATSKSRAGEDYATSISDANIDFATAMKDSSADFDKSIERMDSDYSLSVVRSGEDFSQSMTDMRVDYQKAMTDMAEDFDRNMNRSVDDFEKQMRRMEKEFDKAANRAADAVELAIKRINDNAALQIANIGAGTAAAIASMTEQFFGMYQNSATGLAAAEQFIKTIKDSKIDVSLMSDEIQAMYKAAEMLVSGNFMAGRNMNQRTDSGASPVPGSKGDENVAYNEADKLSMKPDQTAARSTASSIGEVYAAIGQAAGTGFIAGITDSISKVWDGFWQGLLDLVNIKYQIRSPSKVFENIGKFVVDGFVAGIASIPGTLWNKLTEKLPTPTELLGSVTGAFASAKTWFESFALPTGPIATWISDGWDSLWSKMPSPSAALAEIKNVFEGKDGNSGIKGFIVGLPQWIMDNLPGADEFLAAFGSFTSGFQSVLSGIVDLWNQLDLKIKIDVPEIGPIGAFENKGLNVAGKQIIPAFGFDGITIPKWSIDTPDLIPDIINPFAAKKNLALGGIATQATNALIGEAGYPEAVIPLNQRGAEVLAATMARYVSQSDVQVSGMERYASPTYNYYSNNQDYSTNITGAITVQSQNPDELAQKLSARAKRARLAQPIGGSR